MVEIFRIKGVVMETAQSEKLLALIASGLQKHAELQTKSQLGDRRNYIGMSDIALMGECVRLTVLRKKRGVQKKEVNLENYKEVLTRELTLQRGHWLEEGIANALYANNFKVIPQLEIDVVHEKIPIKIHLDFVLVAENTIRILELKSNAQLPKIANKNYEVQLCGQASFLKEYWNQSVFNLKDIHGTTLYQKCTFPEICKQYLGITVQKEARKQDIQGWILAVSMNDAKAFGAYVPSKESLQYCYKTAKELWEHLQNENELPHAKGFCLSCSYCEFIGTCKKFELKSEENILPEWEQRLKELEKLKSIKEEICKEISLLEESIKQSLYNSNFKNMWIQSGKYRFKVAAQQGRKTLDKALLTAELLSFMPSDDVSQLLANCEKESAPSARLTINTIKE